MSGRIWTPEETEVVVRMYPEHFATEIANMIPRTATAIQQKALKLGLVSSEDKIRRAGLVSLNSPNSIRARFQSGHIPHNKGVKMSEELYDKCRPTMFRKGNVPLNHREVGSERTNRDGYIEVKVAEPNKWQLKQRVVWEKANGAIPKGYNVQFRNRNPLDCRLENLYIISRAEQMRTENSYIAKYPKELQDVIRLKGALNRKIRKAERENE